ncbi:MAG: hypothetical protein M0Q12_00835 [Synergistaceae bacterium]|jgi:hypothetical protein|nr:hypothetical protein [Synergistaceae bacterium]
MSDETRSLILPEKDVVRHELQSINAFQAIVHETLKAGLDYGTIPGTKRPTLLKPGAEKITKLLGLCDTYDILQQTENWEKPFFYYQVRCNLTTASGLLICQGLGSCNSMETKYRYRWLWPDEAEAMPGFHKENWPKKLVKGKGGHKIPQYRFDNEEIYSQVNTLLKMGKKRAMIDAALSAGRLSELFTQDIEDMEGVINAEYDLVEGDEAAAAPRSSHFCAIHNVPFDKHENAGGTWYSHKIEGTKDWCTEGKPAEPAAPPATVSPPPGSSAEEGPGAEAAPPATPEDEEKYHFKWLHKALTTLKWGEPSMANYLDNIYHIGRGLSIEEAIKKLKADEMKAFYKEVNSKLPK